MSDSALELRRKYDELSPLFDRLGNSVVLSVKDILAEKNISVLDIGARTKQWDSAKEKLVRKEYANPFSDMEDWCGVRIICYYPSDVEKIAEVLRNEFDVLSEENTAERLGPQEFGYRSTHLIVRMKPDWLHVPAHRGLKDCKAEVQVRTVLMHAWAEIQHKLAYKSQDQVPVNFQRQLYRLSAKFEEADEQFDILRRDLQRYRRQVRSSPKEMSLAEVPLNLETLQAFLDASYPSRKSGRQDAAYLLSEIQKLGLNFQDLHDAVSAQQPILQKLEGARANSWLATGALRNALDISNDKYLESRRQMAHFEEWFDEVRRGRGLLGRPMPWE